MRIAVIGGGAAGMMAAATINETTPEAEVFLIEKNPDLGKKVLMSGGGRCNVTTGIEEIKPVLTKYPRGSKFLTSAMHKFPPAAVVSWFEEHGVPLKCEDDMRVFPVSDKGSDIVGVFERIYLKHGTKVLKDHAVKEIKRSDNGFVVTFKEQPPVECDKVILAVGGQARRQTGSSGDGYAFAESLGHKITTLAPSLHSFITEEKWPRRLSGVSLQSVTISAPDSLKPNSFTGPLLFTHTGISGPSVFALSSLVAYQAFSLQKPLRLEIDLLPNLRVLELEQTLISAMQSAPRKSLKNTLQQFVPLALAEIACERCEIPSEKKNAEINKTEREKVEQWLKHAPLRAILRGAGSEFVTAGGVDLSEVDPRTMESKVAPGLYFAGEVLDVDGFTGGFNLQASWATGRLAGLSSCK
jgi:predicted Rossmann fold flavoprotein